MATPNSRALSHLHLSITLLCLQSVTLELRVEAPTQKVEIAVGHVVLHPLVLESQLQVWTVAVKLHGASLWGLEEGRAAVRKSVPNKNGLKPWSPTPSIKEV